jgi:hypothetical protein
MLCVVTKNILTKEVKVYETGQEEEMLDSLFSAKRLIAHNGREFDLPALGNIFPEHNVKIRSLPLIDTRWAAIKDENKSPNGQYTYAQMSAWDKKMGYPQIKALNSVQAWGHRMEIPMIEDFKEIDWETVDYTPELGEYCKVDVEITYALFMHLMDKRGHKISG